MDPVPSPPAPPPRPLPRPFAAPASWTSSKRPRTPPLWKKPRIRWSWPRSASLQALRGQLTPASKAVLDRIQAGRDDITQDEWTGLCKELKSLGAISESDFQYTRADLHMIPIGYWGENGEFVKYELPAELKNKLLSQAGGKASPSEDGLWACLDDSGWTGDPLAYLDNWISSLYDWRSELARARNGDGTPKYSDFSPITNQINACQKVAALVRELSRA